MSPETERLLAQIRNDSWMVRNYSRNRARRDQAILKLGLTAREAFNEANDLEALKAVLATLVDGLFTQDRQPF